MSDEIKRWDEVRAMAGESDLIFRSFERRDDKGDWHKVECEHLMKGDIFRAYEPGGSAMPGILRMVEPFHPIDEKGIAISPGSLTPLTNWACKIERVEEG